MENLCTDIIIPIYNAYDATKECIASIIESTDLTVNRLILINDCSPDERITPLINSFKNDYPKLNIDALENETNLGFVGTVNRGMQFSKNDVILLNSDTQVSKNWVEKIRKCAYSDKTIGSVTPLSNNATLVSAPNGLQRNEPLEDISLDEYNALIEKCSYREYPELPTAHGFCMFIKREALNLVGFFDQKSFEKGYGEENDFSFRLLDFGYKNVLCDDTLVYHKESQSFSNERNKVLEKHLQIIKERYPQYDGMIGNWCQTFPIKHICENISVNLNLYRRRNVLLVIHEFENTFGGTTLHMFDIINSLRERMNFHVLYPVGERYVVHSFFKTQEKKVVLPHKVAKLGAFPRYNSAYKLMIKDVIRGFGIDALHVHHIMRHYFDVIDAAKEAGVYSVITLHDYYCLCPNQNLLFCGEKYCLDMDKRDCKRCLIDTHRTSNDITEKWRADWKEFLQKFDRVIVPSEDTKENIKKYYDTISIEAIEHGINLCKSDYTPMTDGVFNVAFIGVMCKHKGGYIINDIIKKCANSNIHFHVFGKSEIEELEENRNNYTFHGPYNRDELNSLLHKNNINLICFLQLWPETYSYTLNEAINAGIPVLTTNIGAGKDRVKQHNLGWVAGSFDPTEIVKQISEIGKNKEDYLKVINNIASYKYKTVDDMAEDYSGIYGCGNMREPDYRVLSYLVKENIEQDINTLTDNNAAAIELFRITHSFKWRLLNKIRIPVKIKSMLRFIYRRLKKIKRGTV